MKSTNTLFKFLFFLLVTVSLMQCNNSSKQKEQPVENNEQTIDMNSIFDGKTLDGWEITQFATQGSVYVSDGKILLDFGDGCTGITSTKDIPKIDYEVTLDARRTSGSDFFCGMTFPVNDDFCSLIVGGWGGLVVGLSNINGEDADNNETKVLKKFETDVWYSIKLKVTTNNIEGWIDNEKLVDYAYKEGELGIRHDVNLSTPLGICSWRTSAELRNIKLKRLETLAQ